MQRRRAEGAVPEHLGVEVGVDIHEARTDQPPVGVQIAGGGADGGTDGGNPPVVDGYVGPDALGARPIYQPATPDHHIVHGGDRSHPAGGEPYGARRYAQRQTTT